MCFLEASYGPLWSAKLRELALIGGAAHHAGLGTPLQNALPPATGLKDQACNLTQQHPEIQSVRCSWAWGACIAGTGRVLAKQQHTFLVKGSSRKRLRLSSSSCAQVPRRYNKPFASSFHCPLPTNRRICASAPCRSSRSRRVPTNRSKVYIR